MKKVLSLILCFGMMPALLSGCGGNSQTETTPETTENVQRGGSLKVLAIGNSFSEDAMHLLYEIAQKEGIEEIVLGNLYIGSCTLKKHAENATTDAPAYTYMYNKLGEWTSETEWTMKQGLQAEQWDVITLQQVSAYTGLTDTYNEDIQTITDYVNQNKINPESKLYWHMTWAYPASSNHSIFWNDYKGNQLTMYKRIVRAVQEKIVPNTAFSGVLPVGTAVQNARTSYVGDRLDRDTLHLNDLGRVIAAYTWFSVLTDRTLDAIALNAVPSRLTKSYKMPGDMVLTEGEKLLVAESVKNAIANPYTVTQSQYTTEPG